MRPRTAVATIMLVVVVVVVIVAAGVAYAFVLASPSSPGVKTTTSTLGIGTVGTSAPTTTVTIRSETSGTTGLTYYSGSFNYSLATGPSGVRSFPNGTAHCYDSTEVGSGSFTLFIDPLNYSGSGSGQGTITVMTSGFCSGSQTIHHAFKIPDATTILGNVTVFFGPPTPANYSVPLSCTGSLAGASQVNNPYSYLAEYPGELNVAFSAAAVPVSVVQHEENFTWGYSVSEAG